jgi:GT2 family glycosyltransferase
MLMAGLTEMKLFIYIPTYNRPNAIRAQLSALAPQVANHKDRVRVLVSDNASPHGIYDDLQKEFGTDYIRFRKNAGNIGGNANIMLGFVFAKSDEFLWILSDNDIVTPTAIEYLISQLRTDIDFICAAEDIEEEEEIIYDWKEFLQ